MREASATWSHEISEMVVLSMRGIELYVHCYLFPNGYETIFVMQNVQLERDHKICTIKIKYI